jgi:hypothetical protein
MKALQGVGNGHGYYCEKIEAKVHKMRERETDLHTWEGFQSGAL